MKQTEQDELSMWKAVRKALDDHKGVWETNGAFSRAVELLREGINAADRVLLVQSSGTASVTNEKNQFLDTAVDKVLKLSNGVCAYAMEHDLIALQTITDITETDLTSLPQNTRAQRMRAIVEAAQSVPVDMTEYGASTAEIEGANAALERYEGMISAPRARIAERKSLTDSIPNIQETTRNALTRIDKMLHLFDGTAPEMTGQYRTARSIVTHGTRHQQKPDGSPPQLG